MQKKRRELFLRDQVKRQAEEARDSKFIQLGNRCHLCTVILAWLTVFGYLVGLGSTLLYLWS